MILWLFEYTQCVDDYFNEISIASMLCNQQLPKSAEMCWSTPVNMMHDICLNGHIDGTSTISLPVASSELLPDITNNSDFPSEFAVALTTSLIPTLLCRIVWNTALQIDWINPELQLHIKETHTCQKETAQYALQNTAVVTW